MNRALAYGLMGAAEGFLGGLYKQWEQNQEDIRTQKLLKAKAKERAGVEALAHRYRSMENVKKVQMAFANDKKLADQKAASDQAAAKQEQKATAALHAKDNEADVRIANIRAAASNQPNPPDERGKMLWKLPDDSYQWMDQGDVPPPGSQLQVTGKGTAVSHHPTFGLMGPTSLLNGGGMGPAAPTPAAPAASPTAAAPPPDTVPLVNGQPPAEAFHNFGTRGTSKDNPVDATALKSAPPAGTWIKLPNGHVTQSKG